MQAMIGKLSHIISEVNVASDALNNAAGQVSATAQSLSQSSSRAGRVRRRDHRQHRSR